MELKIQYDVHVSPSLYPALGQENSTRFKNYHFKIKLTVCYHLHPDFPSGFFS
jgi:hypothetical protein